MKTIEIHPLSAALGATFVGLILVTVGFSPVISSCSSGSSGSTSPPFGFGTGEGPYDVTILNDLAIESMPTVDVASMPPISATVSGEVTVLNDLNVMSMPSVDIASIPAVEANVTGSVAVLNELTVASMPSVDVASMPQVDIATIPAVDIASMPALDLSSLTSIRVKGIPTHEDFVVIESGTPYTVPVDKVFVPTGVVRSQILGSGTSSNDPDNVNITFDGIIQAGVSVVGYDFNAGGSLGGSHTVRLPLGLFAISGALVDVSISNDPAGSFRLLGYLEEA